MALSGVNPLAMQGLSTGLDTQSIITELMKPQQARLDALNAKKEALEFRKSTLRKFNTQVLTLQQAMLDLKLNATFSKKKVTSSNEGVVTATVQSTAGAGQHTIKVNQLAQVAQVNSNVYTPRLSASPANTAGLTGLSGALTPTPMYLLGGICEGTTVDTIGQNIGAGTNNLAVTVDGTQVNVTLAGATANTTSLSTVATDLESKINDALNLAKGTSNVTYVLTRLTSTAGASNDKIYLMSNFDGAEHSISVSSTSPAAAALGFNDPANITTVAGTDPAGGDHNLTFTDATKAQLQGSTLTTPIDFSVGGPYQMNITVNDTTQTYALNGTYNDLDLLASDLQSQHAGFVDITNQGGKLTFTAPHTGDNTITVTDLAGTPCSLLGLTSGVTATGANAKVVDVFTPTVGATVIRSVEDTTDENTDSTMAGLLKAINGATPDAGHTTAGGGPLMQGVTFTAAALTAGTALVKTGSSNELNTTVATNATYVGAGDIATTTLTTASSLSAAGFKTAPSTATNGTFTINGKTITINDYATETVNVVLSKINASGAGVTASYDSTNDRFILTANTTGDGQNITIGAPTDTSNFLNIAGFTGSDATFTAGTKAGSVDPTKVLNSGNFSIPPTSGIITINDVPIYINAATDTLNDVIKKINTSAAGVTASYNSNMDTFSLVSTATENGRDVISLGSASDTSNFFYATKLVYPPNIETDATPTVLNTKTEVGRPGQRSLFQVDGISYNRKGNAVTDVLTGVSMTLQAVSSTPVTLDITANTDETLSKIKTFIVEYNKTVEMASPASLTTDERKKQLPALTTDQQKNMTYTEIEDYNTNRDALRLRDVLGQDSSVLSFYNNLRRIIDTPVSGVDKSYNTLRQVGIGTGEVGASWEGNPHGMLLTVSTDPAAIESSLNANTTFMDRLTSNTDEMSKLFTQLTDPTLTLAGTVDAGSVTLSKDMKVRVGNGTNYTEVSFTAGTYTGDQLASKIDDSLNAAGISDLTFSKNSANKIQVVSSIDATYNPKGKGSIDITDITGNLFSSLLGLTPGSYPLPSVFSLSGVARRVESFCSDYTKTSGVLYNKIKSYGDIDREIGYVDNRITEIEDRMESQQKSLWTKFTNLETYMSQANAKSQWLSQRLSALNGTS